MALGKVADVNLAERAALTGGNWVLPLSNLLVPVMISQPARCDDVGVLSSSEFTITLARARSVNFLGLLFHSMSRNARIRISLKDSSAAVINTPEWEDVTPRLFPTSNLEWEQTNFWDGRPLEEDLDLYPRNFWFSLDNSLTVSSIVVEIDDSTHPDGAFDIGYLFVARAWSPGFNFERGRELNLQARDRIDESLSGHPTGEYRRPRRQHRIRYGDLTKDEAMRFVDAGMRVGTLRPILFIPDFDDKTHLYREAFLATLESPPGARFNFQGVHGTEMILKEIMR